MNPSQLHFQLLRRLRQQLLHQNGMCVVYLFSDHELANQWLFAELDAHLRASSRCLEVLRPSQGGDSLPFLLEPLLAASDVDRGNPFWLALSEPHPDWDSFRSRALARLNENRSKLAHNCVFLFLVLPVHFENQAASVAPDLWSVRSAAYKVPAWGPSKAVAQVEGRLTLPMLRVSGQLHNKAMDTSSSIEMRWQAQWTKWNNDPNQHLEPTLAWQLVDQLLELQRPDRASVYADQALAVSRQLKTLTADAPQSLRDLSVSLEKVGTVARDLGQLEEARSAYRESLEISRQLKTLTVDAPQSLRDLSISLANVGDVARDLGQLEEARSAYRESLEISRQLKTLTADAPQSLRDLSVSLEKVGDVARDLGQLEEARSAYVESLEISRQLETLTADAPQSLRDLSVSLNKVGDVARDLGQLEEARSAYRESLEISRQLKTLTADAPQSLRDLSVSLNNLGNVARDLGQLEEARSAYREALNLVGRLRAVLASDLELVPFEASLASRLKELSTMVK